VTQASSTKPQILDVLYPSQDEDGFTSMSQDSQPGHALQNDPITGNQSSLPVTGACSVQGPPESQQVQNVPALPQEHFMMNPFQHEGDNYEDSGLPTHGHVRVRPALPTKTPANQIPNIINQDPQAGVYSYSNNLNPQNTHMNPMNPQPPPLRVVYPSGNQNRRSVFNTVVQSVQQGYNMQNGHADNHQPPVPNSQSRLVREPQRTGHSDPPTQRLPSFHEAFNWAVVAQPDVAPNKRARVEQPEGDSVYEDADDDPSVNVDDNGRPTQREYVLPLSSARDRCAYGYLLDLVHVLFASS
jgi:hypothetical protein